MINDNLLHIYDKLNYERKQKTLYDRYPGSYRALVVETNDPLNIHRIRFKMPEMHNFNLSAEECPWAVPSFEHGGKGSGSWSSCAIGDIVWITFEKQHPYGPIWHGHAEPTRRRFYKLHALFQDTQVFVDEEGKPEATDPITYQDYLPKDGRPYSTGTKDRYGNILVMDETGFFPSEHSVAPAPVGTDAIANARFGTRRNIPQSNAPDRKMMAMVSKFGHYMILGDQGYDWQKDFSGDFEQDHSKEKVREANLIKTLNEDEPDSSNRDQRRVELRTGYGHKIELRDVGWASPTTNSGSRADDWFESSNVQSTGGGDRDERWLKVRTKAGHLMQFMDMGADAANDEFIRRNRIEEVGGKVDEEDDNWQDRDARQMRFVTRYGFKFVLDDRGSSPTDAEGQENPRGNGWLIKGRRDNKGFGWEVNEKDELNRSIFYSPKSKAFEINDNFDYLMMCTDTNQALSRDWEKLKENEFATGMIMSFDPQLDTYHCKLDLANEFLRLKTPASGGLNQGFEARNETGPNIAAWVEMMDRDNRAIIMNSTKQFTAWHDPREMKFMMIDDNTSLILIRNKQGKIQIHSTDNVEVKSDKDIIFDAAGQISFRSGLPIVFSADELNSPTSFSIDSLGFGSDKPMFCPTSFTFVPGVGPGFGAGVPIPKVSVAIPYIPNPELPLTPTDRGQVYNSPFTPVDENVITG